MTSLLHHIRGLLFVAGLALVSYGIIALPMMASTGLSSLVIAIIIGIAVGNLWHLPPTYTPGIQFSAKRLLRTAIVLYGFRVSFQQMASVGIEALVLDVIVVSSTLLVGYLVGRKLLKLDRDLSLLISVGSAICGAAAVLAVEDILKSDPYKAAVAVGTVVIFGTLAMFLYPALQHAHVFGFTANEFGIFTGASIHEVAQALVAGSDISNDAGKIAVIVKMIRVLLLVPVLFLFAIFLHTAREKTNKHRITIPWFAILFVIVIGFNSLHLLSANVITIINQIDIILLTMAMGAIGLETKLQKIKHVGLKPLYLAIILFFWLMSSVFLLLKII